MGKQVDIFYTNARFGGQTALLAGPFFDIETAEFCIDLCQPLFEQEDPSGFAEMASYGVMRVDAIHKDRLGLGIYNRALRANGVPVEVPN